MEKWEKVNFSKLDESILNKIFEEYKNIQKNSNSKGSIRIVEFSIKTLIQLCHIKCFNVFSYDEDEKSCVVSFNFKNDRGLMLKIMKHYRIQLGIKEIMVSEISDSSYTMKIYI